MKDMHHRQEKLAKNVERRNKIERVDLKKLAKAKKERFLKKLVGGTGTGGGVKNKTTRTTALDRFRPTKKFGAKKKGLLRSKFGERQKKIYF